MIRRLVVDDVFGLAVVSLAAGCGSVGSAKDAGAGGASGQGQGGGAGGGQDAAAGSAGGATDGGASDGAPPDIAPARNPSAPFGTPVPIPGLNTASNDEGLSLLPDGLVAYFYDWPLELSADARQAAGARTLSRRCRRAPSGRLASLMTMHKAPSST